MKGDIKLNGILLPVDTKLARGYIDFEVTERTINRTLVSDFITLKNTFSLSWDEIILGNLLAFILDIYLLKEDVTIEITNADLTTNIYNCHLSISQSILREIASGDYAYSGFNVKLEEI